MKELVCNQEVATREDLLQKSEGGVKAIRNSECTLFRVSFVCFKLVYYFLIIWFNGINNVLKVNANLAYLANNVESEISDLQSISGE